MEQTAIHHVDKMVLYFKTLTSPDAEIMVVNLIQILYRLKLDICLCKKFT